MNLKPYKIVFFFSTFIFGMFISFQIIGQENKYTIVQAEHVKTITSPKKHWSYFFVFKVKDVIKGNETDSMVVSQEIYHDFGGIQTVSKFEKGDVILKYSNIDIKDSSYRENRFFPKDEIASYKKINIIWVAEQERKKRLIKLEKILANYNIPYLNLLEEQNGKFFFSIENKRKVAVESRSGYWVIATIDENY